MLDYEISNQSDKNKDVILKQYIQGPKYAKNKFCVHLGPLSARTLISLKKNLIPQSYTYGYK